MEQTQLTITSWKVVMEWKKHPGPRIQQTWILVYKKVLTGYISLDKVYELFPHFKTETKAATTFSTSKDYCENSMRSCMGQCFVNLT